MAGAAPGAGQWTEAPGEGWFQLTVFHHDTRQEFDEFGDKEDFFADGHAITTSAFLTGVAGVVRGVDVWAQLPVHRLSFDDAAGERERTGIGDPRFHVRISEERFGLDLPVAAAVRGGVKLPGSRFPVDAEIIPVTEGQRDWELIVEVGRSFWPSPVYAFVWLGYRWREFNEEVVRDPGDERFALLTVGGEVGEFTWRMVGEGLWGLSPVIEGITIDSARRKMIQLLPTVGWRAGPGAVELGGRFPLDGRNLPAGTAVTFGYFVAWGL